MDWSCALPSTATTARMVSTAPAAAAPNKHRTIVGTRILTTAPCITRVPRPFSMAHWQIWDAGSDADARIGRTPELVQQGLQGPRAEDQAGHDPTHARV